MNTLDLGPVLDEQGNAVDDADVMSLALEKRPLDVWCDGLKFRVIAQRHLVPFYLTQLLQGTQVACQVKNLAKAGFTEADSAPGGLLAGEGNESALANDARWPKYLELMATDEDLFRARANMAAPAILDTNVPELRGKPGVTGDDLIAAGRYGQAVAVAVANFIQSSKRESPAPGETAKPSENTEASETPAKANGKAKSATTPDSTKEKPEAT